ncbi:Ribosomal protein S3 family protein, partial [Prunus dulcis]
FPKPNTKDRKKLQSPLNSNPSGAYHSCSNEQKAKGLATDQTRPNFVADGVFFAELNEVLTRELAEDGYSGVEVRVTPVRTEIIIRATRTQNVRREEELENWHLLFRSVLSFRRTDMCLSNGTQPSRKSTTEGFVPLLKQSLCVTNFLEGLLFGGHAMVFLDLSWRVEQRDVIVSGKLRAQRAKSMKFKDRYMISSGQPVNEYIDSAVRHVLLRRGVLGMKVKIMLDWDPKGKQGPTMPLPDLVTIHQPKEEGDYIRPSVVAAAEIPVLAA